MANLLFDMGFEKDRKKVISGDLRRVVAGISVSASGCLPRLLVLVIHSF